MYKIELTLTGLNKKHTKVGISIEGESLAALKDNANNAMLKTLKDGKYPCGYYDVEMLISEDAKYYDHEDNFIVHVDKLFKSLRLASLSTI